MEGKLLLAVLVLSAVVGLLAAAIRPRRPGLILSR